MRGPRQNCYRKQSGNVAMRGRAQHRLANLSHVLGVNPGDPHRYIPMDCDESTPVSSGGDTRKLSPYAQLAEAAIEMAITDYVRPFYLTSMGVNVDDEARALAETARVYLFSNTCIYSFEGACDVLRLDPDAVREAVRGAEARWEASGARARGRRRGGPRRAMIAAPERPESVCGGAA